MHDGQVDLDVATVRRAVRASLPEFADLEISPVRSGGTVVAVFRLGAGLVARFPLLPTPEPGPVVGEGEHAREIAPQLPVPVPSPVAVARPGSAYPGWWSVWTWLDGESLDRSPAFDARRLATDLAAVVRAHHAMPTRGRSWNAAGRGGQPLRDTGWVRRSIDLGAHLFDPGVATSIWERALTAPPHDGPAVFVHGDLMPGNVLVRGGRLAGVIDNGCGTFGDPAADLAPAWYLFDDRARRTYVDALAPNRAECERARGWAFEMAIGGLHYYEHTNRVFFDTPRRTLDRLLADEE